MKYTLYDLLNSTADDSTNNNWAIDADDWPLAVPQKYPIDIEGREMKMMGPDDTVYAGHEVRQMMEGRRFRPESYTWLGYTKNPNRGVEEVGVPHESLFKHTAMFGVSGYGKSTVMKNMMLQWIHAGYGLCFVDPKGDDSPNMLETIPDHRMDDVVWVEPGVPDREDTVGFNMLQTSADYGTTKREEEADAISEEFVSLMEAKMDRQWETQMGGVTRTVVKQLVLAEEEYSLLDVHAILESKAERDAFIHEYGENMDQMATKYIEDLDPSEIQPLIQELQELVSQQFTRELFSKEGAQINLGEAIENGKIILINLVRVNDDEHPFIAAMLVRRIWSTIKARSEIPESERTPYFLCLDEFDGLTKEFPDAPDLLRINDILSKARTFRLSVLLANQQPQQLAEDVQEHVFGGCDNQFTFNPGNYGDANELSKGIGDIEARNVMKLGPYKLLGRVSIDGDSSPGLLIHTFPEYPPIRTDEDVKECIQRSIKQYGSPRIRATDGDYGVSKYQRENELVTLSVDDVEVTPTHALVAVLSAPPANNETLDSEWVAASDVEEVFSRHTPQFEFRDIQHDILEALTPSALESQELGGETYYRLTEEGLDMVFGASDRSGGKSLPIAATEHLSEMGYHVSTPIESFDKEVYSGIARPPLNPVGDAVTMDEAKQLEQLLETSYPDLADRFSDKILTIGVAEEPSESLWEIARMLSAADDRHCVVTVPEQVDGISSAKLIEDVFTRSDSSPPLVKHLHEETGLRTLYKSGKQLGLSRGARPLVKDEGVWKQNPETGKLVYESETGEALCEAEDIVSLRDGEDRTLSDYYAVYDDVEGTLEVYKPREAPEEDERGEDTEDDEPDIDELDVPEEVEEAAEAGDDDGPLNSNDTLVESFESLEDAKREGYHVLDEPLVPETVFVTPDACPSREEWSILVVPDDGDPYFVT